MPELLDQHDPVLFSFAGAKYQITYDSNHSPRWYATRSSDLRRTERYYSSPVGAFTAIYTGSAKWVA